MSLRAIVLPGLDGSPDLRAEFAAALAPEFDATVLALPNDPVLDYDGLVQWAWAQLPTGEPFLLVAESFSGPIAIQLAAQRPPGLIGVVLAPPGQKLELGRRLAGNEKLKKLARMVGRMKFHAQALRKKVFERSNEELLEVEQGVALHRLLPHQMLSMHQPLLRKDFYRRFLDHELIQYSLRGVEEKGKEPMIVCLDGSSSMSGDKEIWTKAVTLTLLEIARKQRRLFRSICFSSAETPLQVLDMNPRDRYEVETKTIMDLAEYFPGGGTDFQKPLDAALECLRESRFRKGGIIFITDSAWPLLPSLP